jgi:hypothetical protein
MKDLSLTGGFYANSVQLEDYPLSPSLLSTAHFSLLPVYSDLGEMDDSSTNLRSSAALFDKFSAATLLTSVTGLAPRSYLSVFDNFRSDYSDFSWQRSENSTSLTPLVVLMSSPGLQYARNPALANVLASAQDGLLPGSDLRLSNPATLRSSVRNSVVNYSAFQKVFRPRFDEGRSHSQSSSFANLGLRQPLISDYKVPYLQLLGKNRDSFFATPLYYASAHRSLNTAPALFDSLNTPMYDFPFLLATASDTIRFT